MVVANGEKKLVERLPDQVNSLSIYERIADPVAAVKYLGAAIAKSGMFGVSGEKQGEIFAWECLVRRQPPLMLKETYHVIQGSLSMRAEKMLSNFNEGGGEHVILSRTGDLASIELSFKGRKYVFSLSWETAKGEPFVYSGKEKEVVPLILAGKADKLKVKDKYATPRARSQMMWARVISDGVRAVMPSAICGCYTPEEISDFNDMGVPVPSNDYGGGNGQANGTSASPTVAADGSQGDVIDGEFSVSGAIDGEAERNDETTLADHSATAEAGEEDPGTLAAESIAEVAAKPEYCTAEQSTRINELFAQLGVNSTQIEKALAKRGAHNNRSLKFEAAVELITTLADKLAIVLREAAAKADQEAAEIVGESRQNPLNQTSNPGGPATIEQQEEAKKVLAEFGQIDPGQFNRFKAHMKAGGLKIMDLSAGECQTLIDGVRQKSMAAFFDLSLTNWKGPKIPF